MKSSNVEDGSTDGVLRLQERYCRCNRRAVIKISHSEKNPDLVYVKCESGKCKYFEWVKVQNGENGDEVDSKLHTEIDNTAIASLCDQMLRLQSEFATMKRQIKDITKAMPDGMSSLQMNFDKAAMIVVILFLLVVILVKN